MGGTYFCYLPFVLSQLYSWRRALSRVLHLCVFHKGKGKFGGFQWGFGGPGVFS